ncbi:MAG: tetratricopeptide repeat protein [Chloroflexota bacterium]
MPDLQIRLLGSFSVSLAGQELPVALPAGKSTSLVKLLALAVEHRLPAEQIIEALWPDLGLTQARSNLHLVLHTSRRSLDPNRDHQILPLRGGVVMLSGESMWTDVEAFEDAAATARSRNDVASYRLALALYRGPLDVADLYEDWIADRRTHLQNLFLDISVLGAEVFRQEGEIGLAIDTLQRAVAIEPALEAAHVALMRLYAQIGQRQQALRQFEQASEALRRDLEVEPDQETRDLVELIRAGHLPKEQSQRRRRERVTSHNLPRPLTSFTGRERDMVRVRRLLQTNRLVTLTGPGGVGKTRLAIAIGAEVTSMYPDGTWLVELAPVSDPSGVTRVVADVVGFREQGTASLLDALVRELEGRCSLLIVDNCEHVIDATAGLAHTLLVGCPELSILCTSRETLALPGEVVLAVPPLSVPGPDEALSVSSLLGLAAVRLFVERSRSRRPDFELSADNAAAVAAICRQLDGLPLAIELAAAWIGVASPAQIAERLDNDLELLKTSSRAAQPRQRSMRTALDWSYRLLSSEEQSLFCRLAVFSGGWSLEAAEAVTGEPDALNTLSRLIDKSLVNAAPQSNGSLRYRFLEPVRQYALARLRDRALEQKVRRNHAAYLVDMTADIEGLLRGPDQTETLNRIEPENDNVRAALAWSLAEGGDPFLGLRLAVHWRRFWHMRGNVREGCEWLDALLVANPGAPLADRSDALHACGGLYSTGGQLAEATERLTEALALRRKLGDDERTGRTLNILGTLSMDQGSNEDAAAYLEESLALMRKVGDTQGAAVTSCNLGNVAYTQGNLEAAFDWYVVSRDLAARAGDESGVSICVANMASIAVTRRDYDDAFDLFSEAIAVWRRQADKAMLAACVDGVGELMLETGCTERAAVLEGIADALRRSAGSAIAPIESSGYETRDARMRHDLGDIRFEAALERGANLPFEDAMDYVLDRAGAMGKDEIDLTKREREIAGLVVQGLTNRQIAGMLEISDRTVDTHVSNILRKLNVSSRSQLAVWAAQEAS